MNVTELRQLGDDKLRDLYTDKKEDLYTQRQQLSTGELKDTSMLSKTRHDIARILTILRERQLATEMANKGNK